MEKKYRKQRSKIHGNALGMLQSDYVIQGIHMHGQTPKTETYGNVNIVS